MNNLRKEAQILEQAVWAAGQLVLRKQPNPFAPRTYGDIKEAHTLRSMATAADTESEELMWHYVQTFLGPVALFGEETGIVNDEAEWRLILDGIDGTGHYCHGCNSLWGVMAALEEQGHILYASMAFPGTNEQLLSSQPDRVCLYSRGPHASRQQVRIDASDRPETLRDAQWAFWRGKVRDPLLLMKEPYCHLFEASDSECLNVVSTAGATMMLLKGNLDAFIVPRQAWWDAAPAFSIINAAGGQCGLFGQCGLSESGNWQFEAEVEDIHNARLDWQPNFLAAATPALYDQILAILQGR